MLDIALSYGLSYVANETSLDLLHTYTYPGYSIVAIVEV